MRIVTRPDFDGVVCAALITAALDPEAPVLWREPNDLKGGAAEILPGDIVANLPFDPRGELWFDHHATNIIYVPFNGLFRLTPSAARNVFDYFKPRFSRDFSELVDWADRIDAARFTRQEVLEPEKYDYVLLSMTLSGDRPADEPFWNRLVRLLRDQPIREVMADPEVAARCREVVAQNARYGRILRAHTRMQGPVAVTDLRPFYPPPAGNRFLVYCLFPEAVVNVRIRYEDPERRTLAVSVGHSIFNPECNVHAGRMLTAFNGGGHRGAGAARFPAEKADEYLPQILDILIRNEPEDR
jgi:hypothetical protein